MSGPVPGWPGVPTANQPAPSTTPLPPERRAAILSQVVQGEIMRGARIESQDWQSAVLVYGKPVNHVLHAILTVLLIGLWLVVWIALAISGGEKRRLFSVDEYGRISQRDV